MLINRTRLSNLARWVAVLMVLLLFTVGSMPATGRAFSGELHTLVHISVFAFIAIAAGIGWRRLSAPRVFVLVALIGAFHEVTEIYTHHHPLEINDIAIDAWGALVGTLLQYLFLGLS